MAEVQNPLIGRAKNALGGVVFQTWKGRNVIRSRPLTVANPKTDPQVFQRQKLAAGVEVYRSAAAGVKVGYVEQSAKITAYNAFMSEILKNAISGTKDNVVVNYKDILMAKGTIAPTNNLVLTINAGTGQVSATWDEAPLGPGQSSTDTIVAIIYNATKDSWEVRQPPAARSAETVTLMLQNPVDSPDKLHVWFFFKSQDGRRVCDSVHDENI